MLLKQIKYARAGHHVARYHTAPPLRPESVGHHSAGVAALVWLLTEGRASGLLMAHAVFHDIHEQHTGDIPATAKWAWPGLGQLSKDIEFHHESNGPIKLDSVGQLSGPECAVLKVADMADLFFKTVEEVRMGNMEMLEIMRRGAEVLGRRVGALSTMRNPFGPQCAELLDIVNNIVKDYE